MSLTDQIQMLLCKARHPSCTPDQRLEIRAKIQILQIQREDEQIRELDREDQED